MAKSTQVTTLDDEVSNDVVTEERGVINKALGAGADDQLSGQTKVITIHQTDAVDGADAVFVSLNGYAYQIPRGIPCEVPVEVASILENAKQTTYTQTANGVVERTTARFPFSVQ